VSYSQPLGDLHYRSVWTSKQGAYTHWQW